jgi:hypothetical protein
MHKLGAPVASPAFAKVDMLLLDYDFYGLSAFLNIHYFMNNHDDQECRTGDRRSQDKNAGLVTGAPRTRMPDWRPALPAKNAGLATGAPRMSAAPFFILTTHNW